MESIPRSRLVELILFKMCALQVICRLNEIAIKIPRMFLHKWRKEAPKFTWDHKCFK